MRERYGNEAVFGGSWLVEREPFSSHSLGDKVDGREPAVIHPQAARGRGIAHEDVVRLSHARGACLASARVNEATLPGVLRMATGACWDPLEVGHSHAIEKPRQPERADAGRRRLEAVARVRRAVVLGADRAVCGPSAAGHRIRLADV